MRWPQLMIPYPQLSAMVDSWADLLEIGSAGEMVAGMVLVWAMIKEKSVR